MTTLTHPTYPRTAQQSIADMTIDLWAFMQRHGVEEGKKAFAEAYRMLLDTEKDDRADYEIVEVWR